MFEYSVFDIDIAHKLSDIGQFMCDSVQKPLQCVHQLLKSHPTGGLKQHQRSVDGTLLQGGFDRIGGFIKFSAFLLTCLSRSFRRLARL
ncbi:hypothetical protein [Parapedobacter composti]|uniref:hypothetical protein n=1 Tax=Parapedobacter composti TaxID=623281 RepID=UPI0011138CB3|nr:hypothetical protein [Parapedobacter composti]